jgi:hypothetical protein
MTTLQTPLSEGWQALLVSLKPGHPTLLLSNLQLT